MNEKKEVTGHLLACVIILIWGTTFVSTKTLLHAFTPIEVLFLRFAVGLAALFLLNPRKIKMKRKKHELYFAGAGLCGVSLYFLLESLALSYTLASNVGVIVSLGPFFTAVLAHRFLTGEKLRLRFFIGFVVSAGGVIAISFSASSRLEVNPLGDVLAVLAAAAWAFYAILSKKISDFDYNTIQATRKIFFYGLLFMLPVLLISGFRPNLSQLIEPVYLFNILFLGLGASALCFFTWNCAVNILGAVKTSVYIYAVPVIAATASSIVLHEKITMVAAMGILLALAGLFLSQSQKFQKKET